MTLKTNDLKPLLSLILVIFLTPSIFGQIDTVFSDNGKVLEIGEKIFGLKQGKWITYFDDGMVESEGFYENDKKVGKWTWYHDNGSICSKEKYKNDVFKKGKFWDKEGKKSDISEVQQDAEYPGGFDAYRQFIAQNLKYPEGSIKQGIEGAVVIQFIINHEGSMEGIKLIKGLDPSLDKEALRVVQLSAKVKWKHGTFHGEPINAPFNIPVIFRLE